MNLSRQNQQRSNRSRDPLDRRVDQWIETGKQFVDGVSGTRPGRKRRLANQNRLSGSRLDNLGRWVGDKLDWFLEDEDEWLEPWENEETESAFLDSVKKKPLEAISLRVPRALPPSSLNSKDPIKDETWPEDSSFQVDKWKRDNLSKKQESINLSKIKRQTISSNSRRLPRSSRRRTD